MVKKLNKLNPDNKDKAASPLGSSVKDSAQQIWQAGLGAFARAQQEGGKVFETLVQQGVGMQRKTQSAAEEKISEATAKMSSMASDIGSKAAGGWDKLETIFEDRVAKALKKLGVPSAHDIAYLTARIEELNKSVQKLTPKPATAKRAPAKAATPVKAVKAVKTVKTVATRKTVAKPAAKRTARKSTTSA